MNKKCMHETSIVLQDFDGFSILQCTWACGLQLIELHLGNHEVETCTAAELAAAQRENATLRDLLYEFQNNPNIELGEIGQEKIEDALKAGQA